MSTETDDKERKAKSKAGEMIDHHGIANAEAKAHYANRGDKFTGVVRDRGVPDGKCWCGHVVRFEFYWEVGPNVTSEDQGVNPGDQYIAGSDCCGHVELYKTDRDIDPEWFGLVEKIIKWVLKKGISIQKRAEAFPELVKSRKPDGTPDKVDWRIYERVLEDEEVQKLLMRKQVQIALKESYVIGVDSKEVVEYVLTKEMVAAAYVTAKEKSGGSLQPGDRINKFLTLTYKTLQTIIRGRRNKFRGLARTWHYRRWQVQSEKLAQERLEHQKAMQVAQRTGSTAERLAEELRDTDNSKPRQSEPTVKQPRPTVASEPKVASRKERSYPLADIDFGDPNINAIFADETRAKRFLAYLKEQPSFVYDNFRRKFVVEENWFLQVNGNGKTTLQNWVGWVLDGKSLSDRQLYVLRREIAVFAFVELQKNVIDVVFDSNRDIWKLTGNVNDRLVFSDLKKRNIIRKQDTVWEVHRERADLSAYSFNWI